MAAFRSILGVLAALLAATASAGAEECVENPNRQVPSINDARIAGSLVLKRTKNDRYPFLVSEDCIIVGRSFWGSARQRYIYLGVVNFIPGEIETKRGFLGIQVVRHSSNADSLLKIYRNTGWVDASRQTLPAIRGKVFEGEFDDWNGIHAEREAGLDEANRRIRSDWHAWSDPEGPSSWDFRNRWLFSGPAPQSALVTNMLIGFDANFDENRISIIPFEIGVPPQVDEVEIRLHSNIDAMDSRFTIKIR